MGLTQVSTDGVKDASLLNADINASAAISKSKIETFVNNNADNRLITGSGTANTLNGESTLTYGGTELLISNASPSVKLNDTDNSGVVDINNVGGAAVIESTGVTTFTTNAAERLRIDTSGKVRIGDTTAGYENNDSRVNIIKAASGGTENPLLTLWNPTTAADARAGLDFLTNAQSGTGRDGAFIRGSNDGSTAQANIQFGTISNATYTEKIRFQSGGGISFNGDSAAANAISDYEEGTWTVGIDSRAVSISEGHYTKIGRFVMCQFALATLNAATTGANISGLPFTSKNTNQIGLCTIGDVQNVSYSSGHSDIYGRVNANASNVQLLSKTTNGTSHDSTTFTLNTNVVLRGMIWYMTA